jgi:putative addiction module component (TIGR02574 family)
VTLSSLQKEIIQLNPSERAQLIDFLWDTLDEERMKEIEAKWAAESEDRIDAFERGELTAVDGPSAIRAQENGLGAALVLLNLSCYSMTRGVRMGCEEGGSQSRAAWSVVPGGDDSLC